MIDPASIETLKQSIDIVDIIGNYIELKKAGANWKANCPFHGEKTPSFVVSPSKQIYHCFGCGAGGDAIKFVMEMEKLSYPEAIEKLASNYNIPLRYSAGERNDFSQSKRILEVLQQWYRNNFDHTPEAVEYVRSRGIEERMIEYFGIGYVPDSSSVMQFLNKQHIPLPQAVEAGITAQGERGEFYARLSQRITFPIHSPSGSIVGFGGRTMGNHPAKYINSPQTRLFNKSRLLYGYHLAKKTIYEKKELIVCEGYLDVILLHQAGIRTAVATLGTALTSDHLPLLRKGEPKITLAYDGDKAGVAAALKAAQMLSAHGFEGSVVLFPEGKDPADMVTQGQRSLLFNLLKNGKALAPFVLEQLAAAYDLKNPHEKEKAFAEMQRYLNTLSPILKESYIPLAAGLINISAAHFGKADIYNSGQRASRTGAYQNRETVQSGKTVPEDPEWQSILKTLLENETLIDEVLDILSPEMAGPYREAFEALIQGRKEHPVLIGTLINEHILPLNDHDLQRAMLRQLEIFYRRKVKELMNDKYLPYAKKSFMIRKIKSDIIPRLKKGELVPYASDIPI